MFMILNEFYIDLNLLKKSELLSWLNFYRILNRFNQLENRKLMILLEMIKKNWFYNWKLMKQSWNDWIYWMLMILNEFN